MKTKFIALDCHQASTTMAVINDEGKLIQETVLQTDGEGIRAAVSAVSGRRELTFEEGTMSSWLYTLLSPVVDRLVVCNPTVNKTIYNGPKNDSLDARKLAELLRGNYLKPVYHETHPVEFLRSCLKTYTCITKDITRCKNRLRALYRSRGIGTDKTLYNPDQRSQWVDRLDRREEQQRSHYLFDQLALLEGQKIQAEKALVTEARKYSAYRCLQTVPGLGPIHAAVLVAVVITPHRFRTKRLFWKYCGLAVVKKSSSDWIVGKKGLELRRWEQVWGLNQDRNPMMKYTFKQATLTAIQKSPFKDYYEYHLGRGLSESLARVTVARKLATVTLALWKKGVDFDPNQIWDESR